MKLGELIDKIDDIKITADYIGVLNRDLSSDYFEQDIQDPDDLWKIGGRFYNNAAIKMSLIVSLCKNIENQIGDLLNELSEVAK